MNLTSFKTFSRNLAKQKTVGFLSISSLAIAIAVVILIGLWSVNEFSFDSFHKDKDKIYRTTGTLLLNNERSKVGSTFKPLGEHAQQQFPEISDMCRIVPRNASVKQNGTIYPDNKIFLTDPNFFTFFTFYLKTGDPQTCLSKPEGIVIDESTAQRYFPGENPIGKNLHVYGTVCQITGLMYNMPKNSHLQAQIIAPFLGYYKQDISYGSTDAFITYFKIANPALLPKLEAGMTELITTAAPVFEQLGFKYQLQPMKDIHFDNECMFDPIIHGNKSLTIIFLLTAFVILLIACINFINLFISTSFLRAKSIGVKKTLGSEKWNLIKEFYWETFYYVTIAVITGFILAILMRPLFNRLADYNLQFDFTDPILYLLLLGISVLIILLAGTFPALYMTGFNTIDTLKGQFKGKNLSFLQKGLVITQFSASIIILTSVFFINKQVNFMLSKDLGFNKENIVYTYYSNDYALHFNALRQEMMNHPSITEVTMKNAAPTDWVQGSNVQKPGDEQQHLMEFCQISSNYFEVMGMKIVDGKSFGEDGTNQQYCIINETAAQMLGFPNPVGERLNANGSTLIIKGVVKDAQTKSLRQKVDPQIYFNDFLGNGYLTLLFKIQGDPRGALQAIESKWKETNPSLPFSYHFLDDTYAELYKSETNASHILSVAIGITLIISVVGLFAMAYYTTQRRLKEVGVRKVNGASISQLLLMLNRDFFIWVGISFLIACPISYIIVSQWLQNFTDRTTISGWIYLLVGIITFLITLCTVSYLTWKAANINPVKVLKNE